MLGGDRDERPDQGLGDRRGSAPRRVDPDATSVAADAGVLDQRFAQLVIDRDRHVRLGGGRVGRCAPPSRALCQFRGVKPRRAQPGRDSAL